VSDSPTIGSKLDQDKLRFDLMPALAEEAIVGVLTYGARKYSPGNWRKVPELERRYFAAARWHLSAWQRGERIDPESGLRHLAHAACCLVFLLEDELAREASKT
jgi:hypothetical protein